MGVKVRERPKGSRVYWIFIDQNGKRKAKRVGDKKTATALAQKVRQKLTSGYLGIFQEKRLAPLFKDYAKGWLERYTKATGKESTYQLYGMFLRLHILPVFGSRHLDEITLADIKELFLKKLNSGLSVSSVLNMKACLSGIFSNAVDDEIIPANPVTRTGKLIRSFKKQQHKKAVSPLTRKEVSDLLNVVQELYPRLYRCFCAL